MNESSVAEQRVGSSSSTLRSSHKTLRYAQSDRRLSRTMTADTTPSFDVIGTFADSTSARAAADALRSAGVADDAIALNFDPMRRVGGTPTREGAFFVRIVVIIVIASIIGTGGGVLFAWALIEAGWSPGGTTAFIIQAASWAIFWHLLIGMWAGYALLSDRSQREFTPGGASSGGVTVRVRCTNRAEIDRASNALQAAGATTVRTAAA